MAASIPYPSFAKLQDIPSPEYHFIEAITPDAKEIRCQVWWTHVDVFDGKVKLAVREHKKAPWVNIPTLVCDIDDEKGNGEGSVTFVYSPCSGSDAALWIDPGTTNDGEINLIFTRL